jgi:polyphosphate kinase 2
MGAERSFDIENPKLPKWIKESALASGGYPYPEKLDGDDYKAQLYNAHLQLALYQEHMARTGTRLVLVMEGRDAAGKGGVIDAYRENLNPRYNITAALPKPSDREATQWYFQRYVDWMPAKGETVLFDRSWYNRAGVEPVMGFCTPEQTEKFLEEAPRFEQMLVNDGIRLFKFWLFIGREMQMKRFHDRRHDPLKRWKISPVDAEALKRFDDYTAARDHMLRLTDTPHAPWTIVFSNDKKRARLNVIRKVLHGLDYVGKDPGQIGAVDERIVLDAGRLLAEPRDA